MKRFAEMGAWAMAILLALYGWCGPVEAQEQAEGVVWPDEWVVFAPLRSGYPAVDAEMLRTIPETMRIPATETLPERTLERRTTPVERGKPVDLSPFVDLDGQVRGDDGGSAAYVFIEVESPREQELTLGMGADWWMEVWLNGEPVFDTLERGNQEWPIGILNHTTDVRLREGTNIIAVRFIAGRASAQLAVGGAGAFAAEQARLEARDRARRLNIRPETLAERLVFPADEQATATAEMAVSFPEPDADLAAGGLAGLQPMPERQLYMSAPEGRRPEVLDTIERRFDEPVRIQLSKYEYPWEDRHLDAIVWTTPPEGEAVRGTLDVRLKGGDGTVLAEHEIRDLSPSGLFFSVGFPEALKGSRGALEVVWRQDGQEAGRGEFAFDVHPPANMPASGRVPLHLLNEPGATIQNAPMTVGVPFPNGALYDMSRVRLVDEEGQEMPLQTRVSAKWSRYGAVKWLLSDFTADLAGEPRTVYLDYGPDVQRTEAAPMPVQTADSGVTLLNAGRVLADTDGVAFRPAGPGGLSIRTLAPDALRGAFVTHENGKTFVVASGVKESVEEHGSEKTVIRRTGWYTNPEDGERFCNFVTRMVFHRDSPVVRIYHTWIFTGDGNKDRIRDMGWRFATAEEAVSEGFLTSFDAPAWAQGERLVQFDHQRYLVGGQGDEREGRTPGVLSARVGPTRVLLGAKDFWQNFPSELEISEDAVTFYNWPRNNPPARFERPVTPRTAHLHRYAHEGEALDFRLPDEYAEDPIHSQMRGAYEDHWQKGQPETANAQGIARTEEMFLYFTDAHVPADESARVMRGLNDESLRAVADPAWVAASGVYGEIHHRDTEKYAYDEHIYEQVVKAPSRWNERLGFYGMWLHGDVPAWGIDLDGRTVALYRALRKRHHGWPVGWLPFARSGDPRMLKVAEAATRQQTDASFCHYASEDVDQAVGPEHFRRQGWWIRGLLPWGGRAGPTARNYTVDSDFLWDAYYLTGYTRARDVALLWGEVTKSDYGTARGPRTTSSLRTSYLDMYQATFDPWFLASVHTLAELHLELYDRDDIVDKNTFRTVGHFWRSEERDFHQYAGGEAYRRLALNNCISYASPRAYAGGGLWPRLSLPLIREAAYAHQLTGDEFFLRRAAAYLDWAGFGVYDGDPEYMRGSIAQGGTSRGIFTGYYIRSFPYGLAAFERAGYRPEPIPNPVFISGFEVGDDRANFYEFAQPEIILRKEGREPVSLMLIANDRTADVTYSYRVVGPDDETLEDDVWRLGEQPSFVEIPADAPDGDYRLFVSGRLPVPDEYAEAARIRRRHGLVLAPASTPDVPEVMRFDRTQDGTRVAHGHHELQYWFHVPEDVEEFWIAFHGGPRIAVWNPDGERVWDGHVHGVDDPAAFRTNVAVPPEHRGKLWRATGAAFTIDPAIPPYFSLDPGRWYNPED